MIFCVFFGFDKEITMKKLPLGSKSKISIGLLTTKKSTIHVGKYTDPMDLMGHIISVARRVYFMYDFRWVKSQAAKFAWKFCDES